MFGDLTLVETDPAGSPQVRLGVERTFGVRGRLMAVFAWAFILGLVLFFIVKKTIGLRVSEKEELAGLDIDEHGTESYAGFQIFQNM